MHCLLCTACPACDGNVVLLNALLCVHGAPACILFCGVLLMLACSCRFSLTTLAGLHVAMPFEWCVQASPSGHVGPPATAGKKRREGRDCETRGGGMGGAVPKRWRSVWCMLCAMHVSTGYAPGPRISVAFIARSSLDATTGYPGIGARTASLRLHPCVRGFYSISAEYLFWRACTLRAPNISYERKKRKLP